MSGDENYMHGNSLKVGSWANIDEGCSIRYRLFGGGAASFVFGTAPDDDFELCIDTAALRELVTLGSEALAQLDAQAAQEQAKDDIENDGAATGAGELVAAGERSA
jgi:hypothetical protein